MKKRIFAFILLTCILSSTYNFCMKKKEGRKEQESPTFQNNMDNEKTLLKVLKTLEKIKQTQEKILEKQNKQKKEIQKIKEYCKWIPGIYDCILLAEDKRNCRSRNYCSAPKTFVEWYRKKTFDPEPMKVKVEQLKRQLGLKKPEDN